MVNVFFYRFRNGAKAPNRADEGSSGYDICACLENPDDVITIPPSGRVIIPTGLNVCIPQGYEIQVRTRSGLAAKNGICVLNSPGTIDSSFRGTGDKYEIKIITLNTGSEPFVVHHGDRLAQMVVQEVPRVNMAESLEPFGNHPIRKGGCGSTGI